MQLASVFTACAWLLLSSVQAVPNASNPSSHQILSESFRPPPVFKNAHLMRHTNLEKGYVRDIINVVIENIDSQPQETYFLPFRADSISRIGGLEVRDKKDPAIPAFRAELAEYDPYSPTQFYEITLPSPLAPGASQTLAISYHSISSLAALPAKINQKDKQYLLHTFSLYAPSAYHTDKQKTKIKFPSVDIPDFTSKPERQGTTFTYGPFDDKPAGVEEEASVRYEFTRPVIFASLLERDVEISQWGGNIAFEERYWLSNQGAHLSSQFSRVDWQMSQHYPVPTSALKELRIPLSIGSADPYFTDDIGNVSTSHFRAGKRDAVLELKPRYPVFGGWKYSFRIGWNNNLRNFLRKVSGSNTYALKVPFLEGPKMGEGVSYEKVILRFVLPEGATNIKFESPIALVDNEVTLHKTFMDTLGRTTLKLTAINLIDQSRADEIVVTYDYQTSAALRKPLTIFAGTLCVFFTAWLVGKLDVSIATKAA